MIQFELEDKPVEMEVEKAAPVIAPNAVLFIKQKLTDEQQAQARENIGVDAEQIAQNKTDIERLDADKLDASELPEAISDALAQAKESGEFDGKDGKDGFSPIVDVWQADDYAVVSVTDKNGVVTDVTIPNGKDGKDGSDYILNETDKQEIASMVEVPTIEEIIAALPIYDGEVVEE